MQAYSLLNAGLKSWFVVAVSLAACGDLEVGGYVVGDDASATDSGAGIGGAMTLPFAELGGSKIIKPSPAFLQGEQALVYDLGASAFVKGNMPSAAEALAGRTAGAAPVHPMYFFFNDAGDPLFGKPLDAELLIDDARDSADYQRPLFEVLPGTADARGEMYSGVWEVVKVQVPRAFQPDSVHDVAELLAVASSPGSGVKIEPSGFAINCPLVDARAYVVPNVSAYTADDLRIPQPQVELWHRGKRVDCFLVNGWESLGATSPGKTADEDGYRLFRASDDDERIQTFDINVVGANGASPKLLVAPVGLMFIPHTVVLGDEKFFPELRLLSGPPPRRRKTDPPGYRPVRWLWNLEVEATNDDLLNEGTLRKADLLDPRRIPANRLGPRKDVAIVNVGTSMKEIACPDATQASDPCKRSGLVCGTLQDNRVAFCEPKSVRYNELCGPAIAQCRHAVAQSQYSDDGRRTLTRKGDVIEEWFVYGALPPDPALLAELRGRVPAEILEAQTTLREMRSTLVPRGGSIYRCAADAMGVGRCLLTCDSGFRNVDEGKFVDVATDVNGESRTVKHSIDNRCGGTFMPGFACTTENVCLRPCLGGAAAAEVCLTPARMWLHDSQVEPDLAQGSVCATVGKHKGCLLPTPNQSLSQ